VVPLSQGGCERPLIQFQESEGIMNQVRVWEPGVRKSIFVGEYVLFQIFDGLYQNEDGKNHRIAIVATNGEPQDLIALFENRFHSAMDAENEIVYLQGLIDLYGSLSAFVDYMAEGHFTLMRTNTHWSKNVVKAFLEKFGDVYKMICPIGFLELDLSYQIHYGSAPQAI
jgi:hypothetical protein